MMTTIHIKTTELKVEHSRNDVVKKYYIQYAVSQC